MMRNKDWREQGQQNFLNGLQFVLKNYIPFSQKWGHDHCEFCGVKFSALDSIPESNSSGYSTLDNYYWVCEDCFKTFKKKYNLKVNDQNT